MRKISYFLRNFFRVSNIGIITFLLFNLLLWLPFFVQPDAPQLILIMLGMYAVSLLLAFSPVGQSLLSLLNGAKKITRLDVRNKIIPLVAEVFESAKKHTPDLPDKIIVRINYDPEPNAFAIGTNTICVTSGLLELPDDLIKGIIAHELGHIALQHTVVQVLLIGSNLMMTSLIIISEILKGMLRYSVDVSKYRENRGEGCIGAIVELTLLIWLKIWIGICTLLLRKSSRSNEYAADKYAFEIGYGYELAEVLDNLTFGVPQAAFLQSLYNTHPEPGDRIGELQRLGVDYSRY